MYNIALQEVKRRLAQFPCYLHAEYAFTWNDDCLKGSHLHTLDGILKRSVGFSYKECICRIVGPLHTTHFIHTTASFESAKSNIPSICWDSC